MITIIDNNQRVFRVSVDTMHGIDIFCNMEDIPTVVANLQSDGYYIIKFYEFYNRSFRRAGKKVLNTYFESNNIDFRFK